MTDHLDHRFCVAPMMDWTDRHCRFFHRLLAPRALLFTEMVTTGAILHGDVDRLLEKDPREGAVVLQLGGSDPDDLSRAVRVAEAYDYAGYDLNCGCPSSRVQRGRFGACLMAEPERVRDGLQALAAATARPISVKCRIGIDDSAEYAFLERFVATTAEAGVRTFVIHARKAWLKGLSPKANRSVPPLRYDVVRRLRAARPDLHIVLNGGLREPSQVAAARTWADGVMVGREAYENPSRLPALEAAALGRTPLPLDLHAVIAALADRIDELCSRGVPPAATLRHVLGLFNGRPGARLFRQHLSATMHNPNVRAATLLDAAAAVIQRAAA
ncbi:MAG: tRNA dihydrouridine(20/20a) synthase DusA [Pseudomonadota bacterium]